MLKTQMIKGKKTVSILLLSTLLITTLSACSQNSQKVSEDKPKQEQEVKVEAETEKQTGAESETRIIKDMAGREVEIPTNINKVYSTNPMGILALYAINPDTIAGLNFEIGEAEKKFTTKEYQALPVLGRLNKGDANGSEEEILAANPDIIIDMGTIEPDWIKGADETQERLGIPTIMVDGTFENSDKAYEFLGELVGSEERAKELADYFRDSIKETKDIVSKIPEDKKVKVYYAGGDGGLSTSPAGSIHSELIDIVGGKNVVGTEGPGNMEVTMEQILNWNPDKIILEKEGAMGRNGSESLYEDVLKDDTWKSVEAVKTGEVYQIPNAPFNWYGRPQSPSRILGTKWLGNLLYPDYFKVDINKETKEFYKKFYNIDLKDSDVDEILTNARPKN